MNPRTAATIASAATTAIGASLTETTNPATIAASSDSPAAASLQTNADPATLNAHADAAIVANLAATTDAATLIAGQTLIATASLDRTADPATLVSDATVSRAPDLPPVFARMFAQTAGMTPSPTEAAVMAIVAPLSGCACIFADQDAPRPPLPYIALRTLSSVGPENEHYLAVDSSGGQPVQSHRNVTIELQAFGGGWLARLERLKQQLRWETTSDAAYSAGIAIYDRGAIHDIGALLDTAFWEPRGMFEIGVRMRQATVDQVGLIETVNVAGTLSGGKTPVLEASISIVNRFEVMAAWDEFDWNDGAMWQ